MINLANVDWTAIGVTITGFVATVVAIKNWFKTNVADIKQLKADGADVDTQVKHMKAILKDNQSLRTEIVNQKTNTQELTKTFGALLKKKDAEIDELKQSVKDLITVVKEGVK